MVDRQEERMRKKTDLSEIKKAEKVYEDFFGKEKEYGKIKYEHNKKMLQIEEEIQRSIEQAEDPLEQAILYARTGNYIDYGAMKVVDEGILGELLQKAATEKLDKRNYDCFKQDLKQAKMLTYVLDNCGEIVLDKLLIKEIKRQHPKLQIYVLVRGKEVLNDATMDDAIQIGLTKMVPVIENGTGIAGTVLEKISEEAKEALNAADVILAKGQGNFESMYGCGLNVYYLFLCKCDWFVKRFGMTKNAGVFLREGEYIT